MKIEKNFFEKLDECIRKRKQDRAKATEKYWKLPATERLHYDSKFHEIENQRFPILFSTIFSVKVMFYLLVGFVFFGFFTGNLTEMMENYLAALQSYFNLFIIFPLIDLLRIVYLSTKREKAHIKLDGRFKLIK